MMNVKFSLLLITAVCIGLVASTPLQETNAQRLARGLPPNPPKFFRGIDARNFPPTPVLGARTAVTSPHPHVTLTGRLEVRYKKDGRSLGHVQNSFNPPTISGINSLGPDQDLLVKLTYNPSHPKQFDILATNPKFPTPFYVGAGTFSITTPPTLAPGTKSTVGFTNVDSTPPGSRPFTPPARQGFVESAIWSIHPTTHQLAAQWINDDGTKPPTCLVYDPQALNSLFFVGDLDAYNANSKEPASAVDLFLV